MNPDTERRIDEIIAKAAAAGKLDLLEERISQLEAELQKPKHQRWQAPINRETT